MSVVEAVEHDLAEMPAAIRNSIPAATALAMAERIDQGRGSPSECGKVLLEAWTRLRELAPPKREPSKLDELNAKRVAREANAAS